MKLEDTKKRRCLLLDSILKSRDITLPTKGPCSQSYCFSNSHVWMWELDNKEDWAPKNGCFQSVVLEKTLKSPLDCKEVKPVNPKGNQSWIFIGRTYAEAKVPILWPLGVKSWLIRNDPGPGKDRRQEEKGATEDEMVGWHHWLKESEQALGDGEGQGSLAWCSPWGCKESDMTERLNHNNKPVRMERQCTHPERDYIPILLGIFHLEIYFIYRKIS